MSLLAEPFGGPEKLISITSENPAEVKPHELID